MESVQTVLGDAFQISATYVTEKTSCLDPVLETTS